MIMDAYYEDRRGSLARPTAHLSLINQLRPHFGSVQPQHINPVLVSGYIAKRRRSRTVRKPNGVSDSTINAELRQLRACLSWARKARWLDLVPYVEVPSPNRPRERFLTPEEAARLVASCKSPHIRLFVLIALQTGARSGAILGLTWDRVDFVNRRIDFNDPGLAPSKKRRSIVRINDTLYAALCDAQQLARSKYVVEYGGGRILKMRCGFASACKAAGLEGVTPHDLRRTAATRFAMKGVEFGMAAAILGLNVATLRRVYSKFDPNYAEEAMKALEG